jgi:hypothetical protein
MHKSPTMPRVFNSQCYTFGNQCSPCACLLSLKKAASGNAYKFRRAGGRFHACPTIKKLHCNLWKTSAQSVSVREGVESFGHIPAGQGGACPTIVCQFKIQMFYIHRCSVSKSYSNAYPEKLRPPGLCLIQPSGYSQSVNASPVDKRGGGLNFGQRLSTVEWSRRPDNASMTGDRQR